MSLSIRKPSSVQEYTHVYSDDPALDKDSDSFDHGRWIESGDAKFLPTKAGMEPTVFRMRHLSSLEHAQLVNIHEKQGVAVAARDAFRRCVRGISDYEFEHVHESGSEVVPSDVVDAVYYLDGFPPGSIVVEVGLRAVSETAPKK